MCIVALTTVLRHDQILELKEGESSGLYRFQTRLNKTELKYNVSCRQFASWRPNLWEFCSVRQRKRISFPLKNFELFKRSTLKLSRLAWFSQGTRGPRTSSNLGGKFLGFLKARPSWCVTWYLFPYRSEIYSVWGVCKTWASSNISLSHELKSCIATMIGDLSALKKLPSPWRTETNIIAPEQWNHFPTRVHTWLTSRESLVFLFWQLCWRK